MTAAAPAPAFDAGRAFLYVLRLQGAEDLLKVGLSRDPLARWSALHPRWFEAFDLDHSVLVEAETRGDAQALETQLHRALAPHRCPQPLTMRTRAGGRTEWYRGAWPQAWRHAQSLAAGGYRVHADARPWLAAAMRRQREVLPGLVLQAHADLACGALALAQRRALGDLLDAHLAFDPGAACDWPADALEALGLRR